MGFRLRNKNTLNQELQEKGWIYKQSLRETKNTIKRLYMKDNAEFMLKIHPKRKIFSDRILRKAVNREIKIANKVRGNFNFLAGFYDFFYTKNYAIFVYEYYSFGTLGSFFTNDPPNLLEMIILMRDLFFGLEELKNLNIIHKNLNENVIYLSKSTLKIGGYEYCEINDCHKLEEYDHNFLLTEINRCVATVPPEVLFNKTCGVKTPIFSFGVIFYKLLHKKYPMKIENVQEMINAYISKEFYFTLKDNIPPEYAFIIRNALQPTYEYRLSPYELKQELNYLYTFCKGHEEELRISVYSKRRADMSNVNFHEPGDQFKILNKYLNGGGNFESNDKKKQGDKSDLSLPVIKNPLFGEKGPKKRMKKNRKAKINNLSFSTNFPVKREKISIKSYLPGIFHLEDSFKNRNKKNESQIINNSINITGSNFIEKS